MTLAFFRPPEHSMLNSPIRRLDGFRGAVQVRAFAEADRAACQIIAAEAARSSYAVAMPEISARFDPSVPLEPVERRWVAVWDQEVVGFADLNRRHVENLFVSPAAQGRGVGTLLLQTVERETIGDLTLSVFTSNPRALALYSRLGFFMEGEGVTDFAGTRQAVWRLRKARAHGPRFQLVAFDFDGVLADSADWMLETLPGLCETFGLARLSRDEIEALRGAPTREVVRALRVPAWKIPLIARRLRRLSEAAASGIAVFPGTPDLLRRLKQLGATTAVVSSNSAETVRAVLGPEVIGSIDHLDCGVGLFGKATRLRRLARRAAIDPAAAVYVGDETRDVEAASRAGFASAAAAWGYATREVLADSRPTVVADSVHALAEWLESH